MRPPTLTTLNPRQWRHLEGAAHIHGTSRSLVCRQPVGEVGCVRPSNGSWATSNGCNIGGMVQWSTSEGAGVHALAMESATRRASGNGRMVGKCRTCKASIEGGANGPSLRNPNGPKHSTVHDDGLSMAPAVALPSSPRLPRGRPDRAFNLMRKDHHIYPHKCPPSYSTRARASGSCPACLWIASGKETEGSQAQRLKGQCATAVIEIVDFTEV